MLKESIGQKLQGRQGHPYITMWNEPSLPDFVRLPRLYMTEHLHWQQETIYEHFFVGSSDWYDPSDRLFFGYAILNDDFQNSNGVTSASMS